jgi:hypothetical protein
MTARPHCRHPGACQAKGEQTHCRWCHIRAIKSAAGQKSAAKRWNSVAMLAARRAVSERRLVMLEIADRRATAGSRPVPSSQPPLARHSTPSGRGRRTTT